MWVLFGIKPRAYQESVRLCRCPSLLKTTTEAHKEKGQEHRYINQSSSYITIIILLSDNMTVDWKSTLQCTVTKSTTEAELLALSLAGSEMAEWLRLFDGLALKINEVPIIWCDNQQTVGIVTKKQEKLHTKLKHVDIHQNWVRQEVAVGRISVQWQGTSQMPADGLTKILPKQQHAHFIRQLGLVDIKDVILRGNQK
jgi:hypothetical protein